MKFKGSEYLNPELLEAPQWRTFFRGIPFLLMAEHLLFPIEVMRQHRREQVDLITGLSAGRDKSIWVCDLSSAKTPS